MKVGDVDRKVKGVLNEGREEGCRGERACSDGSKEAKVMTRE